MIGIGRDAATAFRPYTTTLNGTKVAIIAADQVDDETTLRLDYGVNPDPHPHEKIGAFQFSFGLAF